MLVKQHPEVKRKSGPCLRYVRLSPNRRHSLANVGFRADLVCFGPWRRWRGPPEDLRALTAPGALAWMVRTALRAKMDPLEGRSRFACERLLDISCAWPVQARETRFWLAGRLVVAEGRDRALHNARVAPEPF